MKTNIKIRQFSEADLDAVHRLIHYVVDTCYHDVYPAGALKMYRHYHSPENILSDARSGYCVVAESGGEIVGTGTLIEDNVRRVYVNPEYQNAGIGGMIYRALEQQARQDRLPRLGLGASVIAREFWETQGFIFEKEEVIPVVNDEKLTFFVMSKNFPYNNTDE